MAAEKKLPTEPALVGDKVYLKPATTEDVVNWHHWRLRCDPQKLTCRPRTFRTSAEVAEAFKNAERTPNAQRFAVMSKKARVQVGLMSFFDLNPLNRSAELGLMIDPDEHEKGYGSDAVKTLTRYLFKHRGLNKVYAQTAGFNEAAVAMLESLGFRKDATLRDHYFYDGEFHPGLIYSLLLYEVDW